MRILLLIKKNKLYSNQICKIVKKSALNVKIVSVDNKKKISKFLNYNNYDYLISYLCPFKIQKKILDKINIASINFHPGPPKYPGIGCFNYAIFNKDKIFGVTCHYMNEKIDNGKIIKTRTFKLSKNETIRSISNKSYKSLYLLFKYIFNKIKKNKNLDEKNNLKWSKKTYSKKKFNLFLNYKIKDKKLERYLRATTYMNYPSPNISIGKYVLQKKY